jgi:hypothetical protein
MKTIKLQLPFGVGLVQAIVWLTIFCAAVELFARAPAARSVLSVESYGSSHPQFDSQVVRIYARAESEHIDCIFLGNSQVLYDMVPEIVEATYLQKTGESIRCQNFGLGGIAPVTAAPLARILVKNFDPALIVFGTGVFDYSEDGLVGSHGSVMTSPWVQYQLGYYSVDGWLFTHSQAYRFYQGMDDLRLDGSAALTDFHDNGHPGNLHGHADMTEQEQMAYFNEILANPKITASHLGAFRELLALNSSELQIVVLETPVNPKYFEANQRAAQILPDFTNMLVSETGANGIPLLLTQDSLQFSEDQWFDLIHLNQDGAEYFSVILGGYLAELDR